MDVRSDPGSIDDGRGRKMGVAGGRRCTHCGTLVHWRVEKFCQSKPQRFGGRIYCIRCQAAFPEVAPKPSF